MLEGRIHLQINLYILFSCHKAHLMTLLGSKGMKLQFSFFNCKARVKFKQTLIQMNKKCQYESFLARLQEIQTTDYWSGFKSGISWLGFSWVFFKHSCFLIQKEQDFNGQISKLRHLMGQSTSDYVDVLSVFQTRRYLDTIVLTSSLSGLQNVSSSVQSHKPAD